jgi:membrane protein DedA with SNARE-associated domain
MKILSLILCVLVFFGAGYFLIIDFQPSLEMNSILYMSLLIILMLICVVGVLINYPLLMQQRKNVKTIVYNSYSSKRILNKEFDRQYGMQH